MENNTDILGELTEYEKLIEALGREIALLYETCGALKEIIQQTHAHSGIYGQFRTFFYMVYRHCYSEIYHGISRLIDDARGVVSVIKLLRMKSEDKPPGRKELAGIEQGLADQIQKNETAKKIKNFRDNNLGHKNKKLAVDSLLEREFYEKNKINIDDIEALLHLLGDALRKASERARFHILPIPTTPIRMEICNFFDLLSSRQTQRTEYD